MVAFGDMPGQVRRGVKVWKVVGGQEIDVVLLADRPVFFQLHWAGRAYLCPGDECPACEVGVPRPVGLLPVAVVSGADRLDGLIEVTPHAWARFQLLAGGCGGARAGMRVVAHRGRSRGRLELDPCLDGFEAVRPVARLAVCAAAAVLFRLPSPSDTEAAEAWWERVRPVVFEQVKVALAKLVE